MENIASRPVLDGHELDAAIANARAALNALLGGGTGYPKVITEARRYSVPCTEPGDQDDCCVPAGDRLCRA